MLGSTERLAGVFTASTRTNAP